jgi:hypothetical protein
MKTGAPREMAKAVLHGCGAKLPGSHVSAMKSAPEAFRQALQGAGPGARGPKGHPAPAHEEPERREPRRRLAVPTPAGGDALDPATRQVAHLAPPPGVASSPVPAEPDAPVAAQARTSLEDLLPALVRKVAWSGDGKRGTVRLELGAGRMAGATVLVESDHGRVRVRLEAPAGVDGEAWRRRIEDRLAARGLEVDDVREG